jgi:hypothetical protein
VFIDGMLVKRLIFTFTVLLSLTHDVLGQGEIRGRVLNKVNNESIGFANILVQGTTIGTTADESGKYSITNLKPGLYNLEVSFVGFEKQMVFEVPVTTARPTYIDILLEETSEQLKEVEIDASASFYKPDESPLSLRTIGTTEIKRTPGGNRDISKVVRSLPGVASPPSFRNDIIIRGGAPSENTFYLDGIQIPVINHFQTQGSSGGPVGIINVDLLREVNFYSGAFPANRGNTLSSVFDFNLKEGRSDKWTANGVVGASDLGVTFEGPVSTNSTLVVSARRSYLKFLFGLFNLPFLPVYNDVQFKYTLKLNEKNKLTWVGIGAIDDFRLNANAPDRAETQEEKEEAEYILNIIPVSTQWNYTTGLKYEHFRSNATTSIVVSTNALNNKSIKYFNNDSSTPDNLIQNYNSREQETRFRVEDYLVAGTTKINYGISGERAVYKTDDFNKIVTQQGAVSRNYSSLLAINKWGFFGQISTALNSEKLTLSLGVRADANDYSNTMNNLFDQFSPRFSAGYKLQKNIAANFNTGIYYQLPAYTILGYRSQAGELVNKGNGIKYIRSKHIVAGFEFNVPKNARATIEGFYKYYDRYPFLPEDSISLANLGADFGVIGNAPVSSTSKGKSYGIEFLLQQKLYNDFYGLLSYTWVRSLFEDKAHELVPTSWDNRHLISLTGGKRFAKNWELGVRWLFTGGAPFTPYDLNQTLRIENWSVRPYGVPDYDLLNTGRTKAFHQLDIRIDKKYYFRKWSLNVYVDVQNAYNQVTKFQDNIDVVKDSSGQPVANPANAEYYLPKYIQNTYGSVLPTIGVIIEL